jgi:magnesium and cobalt exporter, CNNM family
VSVLLLFLTALIVVVNGFFVAAEYALVRSRADRVQAMVDEGVKGAELFKGQIERIDEYIATCQIGITMTSIGLGALGEPTLANLLEGPFGGIAGHGLAVVLSGVIAYSVLTAMHVLFGEQVPKVYTVINAERVGLRLARPVRLFRAVFNPLIGALNSAANAVLRLIGVDPELAGQESQSHDDLKYMIARSQTGGTLDPGEALMLQGVFHLHEQEARQVMTPIPAVVTVDVSENVETALKRCVDSGHTRLVVTEEGNTDRIRGIVHANSLVRLLMTESPEASIEPVVKEALIVPETKPLDDLLADLQRQRASMAVVVDEYGRTAGIVTVEDIIEEIVGEIADETDPAVAGIRRLANGDWWVRGHVPITDLADYGLHLPVDSEAYNSVGGFVFAQLGRLPKRGDIIQVNGYSVRVESVRENRVEAVRIREHEDRSPDRSEGYAGAGGRPVEQAAATPRGQPTEENPAQSGETPGGA